MSLLKRLFGGGGEAAASRAPGEDHGGYTIYVEPAKVPGGYRVGARIEKGEQVHQMIRSDVISSEEEARTTSLLKAKHLIDQQGDDIF
ncbi:MAG: HlyU family transcriptional regulator [Pseudomonadota bacterium]